MLKGNYGRIILTVVLVNTAVVSIYVDWNETHLFNPQWTGHAKFHDAAMLHLLAGVCAVGLWLMWRRSPEPEIGVRVAALIPIIFWAAFWYTTTLLPETSLRATESEAIPTFAGLTLYPNFILATINNALAALGYFVYRRENAAALNIKNQ